MASIQDVMTPNPVALPMDAAAVEAAQVVRDVNVGDVLVLDDHGTIHGVLTDRDIVVRAVAEGRDPTEVTIGEICSKALVVLSAADSAEDAIRLMREQAVRRLPSSRAASRSASSPSATLPSAVTPSRSWPISAPPRPTSDRPCPERSCSTSKKGA